MKKLVLTLSIGALAFGLVAGSYGQAAGPAGGAPRVGARQNHGGGFARVQKLSAQILAKLNLTADQKKRIAALDARTKASLQALRAKMKGATDRTALRGEFRKVMTEHRKGLLAILNPAQKKEYQTLWKAEMQKLRAARKAAGANPGQKKG